MSAYRKNIQGGIEDVETELVRSLGQRGFGVLGRIAFHEVIEQKIGRKIEPYVRLGVCNPKLAYEALEAERGVGAVLPCAVALRELPEGAVEVAFLRPEEAFVLAVGELNPTLERLASTVEVSLREAVEELEVAS
ncbi:DUF302 domain-containing protein [Oceanithermus sp.]|uniref:DUF302 domain-containing protein n=1 Tax=Oceanithermus sp. TaxID=2268145 RepID=UPI0025FF360B|nr:DUF302 domain-containing protein [Oceanithermus sp.]